MAKIIDPAEKLVKARTPRESKFIAKNRKMIATSAPTDIRVIDKNTPDAWLGKWKAIALRKEWVLKERRNNGYLFIGTYLDIVFDENINDYDTNHPKIAVIAAIDRINGERWVHVSYTVMDGDGYPRGPLPREASIVREIFMGDATCQILGPKGYADPYDHEQMRHFWSSIDKRQR